MKQSISDLKKDLFESFFEAHLAAENRNYFNEENKEVIEVFYAIVCNTLNETIQNLYEIITKEKLRGLQGV